MDAITLIEVKCCFKIKETLLLQTLQVSCAERTVLGTIPDLSSKCVNKQLIDPWWETNVGLNEVYITGVDGHIREY